MGCLVASSLRLAHAHRNGFIYARKPQMMTGGWRDGTIGRGWRSSEEQNSIQRSKNKNAGAYLVLNLLACRQGDFFGKDVAHAVQFHRLTPIIEGACDEHLVRTVRPTCKCEEPTSQRANPGCVPVPRKGRLELIVDEGRDLGGLLSRALEIAHEPALSQCPSSKSPVARGV